MVNKETTKIGSFDMALWDTHLRIGRVSIITVRVINMYYVSYSYERYYVFASVFNDMPQKQLIQKINDIK